MDSVYSECGPIRCSLVDKYIDAFAAWMLLHSNFLQWKVFVLQ